MSNASDLAELIRTRLMGVHPDNQDLVLEDYDWQLILDALAASSPSPAQGGEEAEKLTEIVSDAEIVRVHGYANFGSMSPREVVNDGVLKTAVGYHCGHTQFSILREHGLVTKPRLGSYDAHLTKKGKAYARALYCRLAPPSVQPVEGK